MVVFPIYDINNKKNILWVSFDGPDGPRSVASL